MSFAAAMAIAMFLFVTGADHSEPYPLEVETVQDEGECFTDMCLGCVEDCLQ